MSEPKDGSGPSERNQKDALYERLARDAARLLVLHEAGRVLRSTSDPEQLALELLKNIAEAVFAVSGCVARSHRDELEILATLGLEEDEADALAANSAESAVWYEVVGSQDPSERSDLLERLPLQESDEEEPVEAEEAESAPVFELYVPLGLEEREVGVLALGKRVDGQPYSESDRELAVSLAAQLAVALSSAELFADKERRIEQLSVLLRISKEITSTLDLDKVLATIVHMLSLVVENRRATLALVTGSSVAIRASSEADFDSGQAGDDPLLPALRWTLGARRPVNTCRSELTADAEAEAREQLLPVMEAEGGPGGVAVLPLEDDQGVLGFLTIESDEDAAPLDPETEELVTILANQTAVAIRNAELYERLPMVGVLQPLLGRAHGATATRRRRLGLAALVLALGLGLLLPLPAWVPGDAAVRPSVVVSIRAETEGTVDEVFVVEGQEVEAGTRLARMRRDELEVGLQQVRAGSERMRAEAGSARDRGDHATYRARQAELRRLDQERLFLETELGRTDLVAPAAGVVLTPHVELRRGARLARGDTFLEMADLGQMEAEIRIPEQEIDRIRIDAAVRFKVHAYPRRVFRGRVVRIAPRADSEGEFRVSVLLPNDDGALRPGMTGRAHVDSAWLPLLYRPLRPLGRWLRLKLWV